MTHPRNAPPAGADAERAAFLRDLRALRDQAGLQTRDLAARAHYPEDTLRTAEDGPALPSLPVLEAYVRGCGARPADWEDRWRRLHALGRSGTGSGPPQPRAHREPATEQGRECRAGRLERRGTSRPGPGTGARRGWSRPDNGSPRRGFMVRPARHGRLRIGRRPIGIRPIGVRTVGPLRPLRPLRPFCPVGPFRPVGFIGSGPGHAGGRSGLALAGPRTGAASGR